MKDNGQKSLFTPSSKIVDQTNIFESFIDKLETSINNRDLDEYFETNILNNLDNYSNFLSSYFDNKTKQSYNKFIEYIKCLVQFHS